MMVAKVIVGLNNPAMDKLFDYGVPEGVEVRQGVRVIVPFGRRNAKAEGYVISLSEETDVPADKLKNIIEVLDEGKAVFTPKLLELAEWMQKRYFCTLNQCLQAMMPAGIRTKSSWWVSLLDFAEDVKLTPKEKLLIDFIGDRESVPLDEVQAEFGSKTLDFLRKMEEKGLLLLKQRLNRNYYIKETRLI
ncbi:MAG: hypothetical protein IJN89_03390, partial [Anaerotignum sp.]|nr:hypothetical protein [Anaerotignum sp.]